VSRVKGYLRGFTARFDPGWLAVLAICLLAVWPFISRSDLPQETDAELHIFRLAELSRVIRSGHLFPRWAPNFYYGFGYPIFNYYAPLTYYLGMAVDLLPVLGPVAAVKAVFVAGLAFAATGMYGFAREWWGRAAGLLAAALFIYAPYVQFVDPHARGDLAEAFSFGLFPLALWSFSRLARQPGAENWLASAGLVAGLILTHNLMAMVFFAILLGWVIWQNLFLRSELVLSEAMATSRFLRGRLVAALLLGVGLAAVFWLVVALEQDAVNLASLVGNGGHFDFRNHFLSWRELLAGPRRLDWGATEPDFRLNLGLAQWLLGGLGFGLVALGWVRARRQALFSVVCLAVLLFFMLPLSSTVWETVPFLPFLQFPWRLLGPASAMLAILGGAGLSGLVDAVIRRAFWLPAGLVAIVLLLALPLSQVPPWPEDFGPTSPRRVVEIELSGRWLGTTSTADFVPATVETMPRPEPALLEDFFAERPLDRVNRVTLPAGTTVEAKALTLLHNRYYVSGEGEFLLRLFQYDFPGWRAEIDGKPVETEVGRPEGFIVVPVPAGEHTVDVLFGSTPSRNLAAAVSVASLMFVMGGAWHIRSRTEAKGHANLEPGHDGAQKVILVVILVAVVVALLNAAVVEPLGLARHESQPYEAIPAGVHTFVDFGGQIALIGYDIPGRPLKPGEELPVRLYWQAEQPQDINYQVFLHLVRNDGSLVTQSDKLNPGDFPTKRWPLEKYVRDAHQLVIPEDLAAGEYRLSVGLWVANEGWRLPVLGAEGQQVGDHYLLPDIIQISPAG
jgi:hypothetical protein